MADLDSRIVAAYLAEQAAPQELRWLILQELERVTCEALREPTDGDSAVEHAAALAKSGKVSVLPEQISAAIERAQARPEFTEGVICEACLEVGTSRPETSSSDISPIRRLDEQWAMWETLWSGHRLWIGPDCWTRRRYAELAELLGEPSKIETNHPTLISPAYRPRGREQPGLSAFDSLADFIAAVETHPTRIPSTSPETQEDAIQPRDHDWTNPVGQPTTEEIARQYPDTEIIEELGKGVTSVVYKVRRPSTGKIHALKVLKAGLTRSAAMQARFRREAEALMRLHHANIVRLIEWKNLSHTMCFLIEWVDGVTLDEVISQGGALRESRALEIAEAICDGLAHAHRQKIVHRDIKAENIFLRHDGQVKIGDFGLAKMSQSMHGVRPLTAQDGLMGTPIYMAPEQRASAHDVDGRADIYSLGVLLHEMLTGRLPREPGPDEAVRLDPVDPRLDRILEMATAVHPDDRYSVAEDFKRALMSSRLGM